MTLKETYINALVDSMSMEDLQQYVANDMADFLYNCSESEVIKNEFLIKLEHTTDEQFYNKFVKQNKDSLLSGTRWPHTNQLSLIIKVYKQSLKTMYTSKRVIRPNDEVVRYYCSNGYGLSVACHEHSYGGKEGLYEIALLKGDKLHYDDHEWQDVRGWLTKSEVWSWLRIVSEY